MTFSPNFEFAFHHTLELEGGWSNHKADSGGRTKFGVTEANWNRYAAENGISKPIHEITVEDAKGFYWSEFWQEYKIELLGDKFVSSEFFDTAVNCGPHTAGVCLQRALNFIGYVDWPYTTVDGVVGPVTRENVRKALAKGLRKALIVSMNGAQWAYYESLSLKERARYNNFTRGWVKRLSLLEGLE